MKLPQITVEYASSVIIDQLGWGGNNTPCSVTNIDDLYDGGVKAGFELWVEFRFYPATCGQFPPASGYTYVQVYDFWYSGVVVPILRIYGPGLQDNARYRVYYRLDLSAGGTNSDDFFEYWAIDAAQYPPYEHDFHDDEVYKSFPPYGYEWVNRDGPPYFKGYASRPWIYSDSTPPPPNHNDYWTFIIDGEQEGGPPDYDTPPKTFTNFPKSWDGNQEIYTAQDLVNWFVSTVQSSVTPSYCKPSNQCGVGIWFTPFNQ